jgi:flagellar hook assembly protein FlgD
MGPDFAAGDFGVDHILLTNGIVGVDPLPARVGHAVELAAPYPNPARGPVSFSIESFESGPLSVSIVDVLGRRIREASLPDVGPGARLWIWDGRDAAGHEAPAGVYRVRAIGRSGGTSRTFVRTR